MAAKLEAEKMAAAVKKAYAEMIYNIEKEAAVRAMAAEMRSHRIQQDISTTNDESIRLLVRLKRMISAKATEVEMRSRSRQSKIGELEEQLEEAEGVIVDLREELKWVREKLHKVRNDQCHPFAEKNEDELLKSTPRISNDTSPDSWLRLSRNSGLGSLGEDRRILGNGALENARLAVSRIENVVVGNLCPGNLINDHGLMKDELVNDVNRVTSANARTGELRRSVCRDDIKNIRVRRSHRRKARFGRTKAKYRSLQSQLTLKPFQPPSIFSWKKASPAVANAKPSSDLAAVIDMKGSGELAGISKHNGGCFKNERLLLSGEHSRVYQPSTLGQCRTYAFQLFGNVKPVDGRSKVTDTVINLKPLPRLVPGLTLIKGGVNPVSRSRSMTLSTKVLHRCNRLQDDARNGMKLADESVYLGFKAGNLLVRNDVGMGPSEETPAAVHLPYSNTNYDEKASNKNEILKHMFHRKRKKEALTSSDQGGSLGESNWKRKVEKNLALHLESQKAGSKKESSRESQLLVEVAHQLISLSQKTCQ